METIPAALLAVLTFLCGVISTGRTIDVTNLPLANSGNRVKVSFAYPQQADLMSTCDLRPITDNGTNSGIWNKTNISVTSSGSRVPLWCFMRHTNGTVLRYLVRAESREADPWYRDDYRIAEHTVRLAKRGIERPFEQAFFNFFGKPIDKALAIWKERDQQVADELLGALPKKGVQRAEVAVSKRAGQA